MKTDIEKASGNYHLTIEYPVSVTEPFTWFSTTEGFSRWFDELHIENGKLVFLMDDFREEMDILSLVEKESVSYQWDQATVRFTAKDNRVLFEEIIPVDCSNEFADSAQDMAGWCTHHERLSYIMNGREAPEVMDIVGKWESWVRNQIKAI